LIIVSCSNKTQKFYVRLPYTGRKTVAEQRKMSSWLKLGHNSVVLDPFQFITSLTIQC
jgi:hypothetical protein